jgi:hypothetical protein
MQHGKNSSIHIRWLPSTSSKLVGFQTHTRIYTAIGVSFLDSNIKTENSFQCFSLQGLERIGRCLGQIMVALDKVEAPSSITLLWDVRSMTHLEIHSPMHLE